MIKVLVLWSENLDLLQYICIFVGVIVPDEITGEPVFATQLNEDEYPMFNKNMSSSHPMETRGKFFLYFFTYSACLSCRTKTCLSGYHS